MKRRTERSGIRNKTSDTIDANKSIPEAQKDVPIFDGSDDGRTSRRQNCRRSQQQEDHGQQSGQMQDRIGVVVGIILANRPNSKKEDIERETDMQRINKCIRPLRIHD
jgi:hypothetical protein